jgi:phage terminase large subunit-like protein
MALSEPIKEFEKAIMDGTIYLKEEDPIFRWMLSNATMKQSTSGIKKIYKPEK